MTLCRARLILRIDGKKMRKNELWLISALIISLLTGCSGEVRTNIFEIDSKLANAVAIDDVITIQDILKRDSNSGSICDISINFGGKVPILHFAVMNDALKVVSFLLEEGCDPMGEDINGELPGEVAIAYKADKVLKVLPPKYSAVSDDAIRDYFFRRGVHIRRVNDAVSSEETLTKDFSDITFSSPVDNPNRIFISIKVYQSGGLIGTETGEIEFKGGYFDYQVVSSAFR